MLDDERAHLRPRTRLELVLEAEDRAEGVDGPVARRRREAGLLAGVRIADLELSANQRGVLGAAGQRCDHAFACHQNQMLRDRALPQHQFAPGQLLIGRARGADHAQQKHDGEAGEARGHLIDSP